MCKIYNFKRIGMDEIEIIKELFTSVFTIEPWNDDWSNPKRKQRDFKKQLHDTGIGTRLQPVLKLQQERKVKSGEQKVAGNVAKSIRFYGRAEGRRMIRLAKRQDLEHVLRITHDTITEIYSHYYAKGVVAFFLQHHSRENVLADIEKEIVWLLEEEGILLGTVTVKENAVNRLFVLPQYQHRGYGSHLMDFAETKIAENYSHVHIDSSLAAKEMYLKRGYREKKTCRIQADNGDILIYDEMEKQLERQQARQSK